MKVATCTKCGKETYVEIHHILLKATFGENDQKVELCANCHTEYHQKLGTENLKNPDMVFHLFFYSKWKYGLLGLLILLAVWVLG
jgi:formate-dependent nitrite reductase cytochrome c552 subunit